MAEMTIKGNEKKIKQLKKELKYRLKHDGLVLKEKNVIEKEIPKKSKTVKKS